jgi:hypothetical protein
MAFVHQEARLGLQPLANTETTAQHPLGTRVKGVDTTTATNYGVGEFIYLKGVASTAVGSWVTYNADDFSTTLLAANAIGPVAIAMSANVANQYGWYQIFGKAVGLVATGFVDDANIYATAVAGTADDAVVAGDRVKNAKGASAIGTPAAGQAEVEIMYPFMDDAVAA